MSAKEALEKYYARLMKKESRAKRKNNKPEEAVKRQVMKWLSENGFSCHVVESKAVYSKAAGRYLKSQTTPGFSDIAGSCPDGRACFIETKAPGRRSTLRAAQRHFLEAKIKLGCFAVCVDSVRYLEKTWNDFNLSAEKSDFLFSLLPTENASEPLS